MRISPTAEVLRLLLKRAYGTKVDLAKANVRAIGTKFHVKIQPAF